MGAREVSKEDAAAGTQAQDPLDAIARPREGASLFEPLIRAEPLAARKAADALAEPIHGVHIAQLLAFADEGTTPLIVLPSASGELKALRARTTVDLHGAHIGREVLVMFEGGDAARPIITGVLRDAQGTALDTPVGQVEVDADGERLIVSAKQQLVLRCGKASITLTKAGKVLIQGAYVSSRSSGVNRIKGGSIQLN
jgi:hypothetical protein